MCTSRSQGAQWDGRQAQDDLHWSAFALCTTCILVEDSPHDVKRIACPIGDVKPVCGTLTTTLVRRNDPAGLLLLLLLLQLATKLTPSLKEGQL